MKTDYYGGKTKAVTFSYDDGVTQDRTTDKSLSISTDGLSYYGDGSFV